METLTLSPAAFKDLGRLLRDRPFVESPALFWEVLHQKPWLLEEDSDNHIGEQACLF